MTEDQARAVVDILLDQAGLDPDSDRQLLAATESDALAAIQALVPDTDVFARWDGRDILANETLTAYAIACTETGIFLVSLVIKDATFPGIGVVHVPANQVANVQTLEHRSRAHGATWRQRHWNVTLDGRPAIQLGAADGWLSGYRGDELPREERVARQIARITGWEVADDPEHLDRS